MWNAIVCLLLELFTEAAPWDPATLNPPPAIPIQHAALPAEPSTLMLALIGIGIFAVFAGVQRWRRVQPPTRVNAPRTHEAAPEPRKRGAA